MLPTIVRILMVIVASASCALVTNALRWDKNSQNTDNSLALITPPKPEIPPENLISFDQARELWETQLGLAFFIDARTAKQYAEGHIASAYSLPASDFNNHLPAVQQVLANDSPIVVYCDGEQCDLSHQVADRLKALGYQNVRILINGWTLWKSAGFEINTGDEP
jgi:rhodanese-related sulfurtransferase